MLTLGIATSRGVPAEGAGRKQRLETWAYPLRVGEPLPELPVWLTGELALSLELEQSYEEACRALRIA